MATTALKPLDPASSPQSISRVLNIRANLLPAEIMAGRNARRMRVVVIVALVLVAALLGAWYAHAVSEKRQADEELTAVSGQVTIVRKSQDQYQNVVTIKTENETITKQLKTLMANDLSWATLTDTVRATGVQAGVTVTGVTGTLTDGTASPNALSTSSQAVVLTLQISGTGPDKKTIAKYVEQLGDLDDLADPYLSSATQTSATDSAVATVSFSLSAAVTSSALCGRFTTACKTGGK